MKKLWNRIESFLLPVQKRCEKPECLSLREQADLPPWHEPPYTPQKICANC